MEVKNELVQAFPYSLRCQPPAPIIPRGVCLLLPNPQQ